MYKLQAVKLKMQELRLELPPSTGDLKFALSLIKLTVCSTNPSTFFREI